MFRERRWFFVLVSGKSALHGELIVPGDKSISHRAIMIGSIANGDTRIQGLLESEDCVSTMECFRAMGIEIEYKGDMIIVHGKGLHGLKQPARTLNAGNSGTTTRLISGILAGQSFETIIDGDSSLRKRPMKRIVEPLKKMGADIRSLSGNDRLPLQIRPARNADETIQGKSAILKAVHYQSPVASAQVKSCILLAGMYASGGRTSVTEPVRSRDHTERMLAAFGADISVEGKTVFIAPEPKLTGQSITVPGDISSAAYFIAAGLITPGSEILIRNVGMNPTRNGILQVARTMGGDISVVRTYDAGGEPAADLLVRSSNLSGMDIGGEIIPSLIDELPVIAVMAAFAKGTTVIRDAAELKVKESDRIAVMTDNLRRMGCDVEATEDGMVIHGGAPLHEATVETHLDHRIAMSFAVAAMGAGCSLNILGAECVNISYPGFFEDLSALCRPI